MKLCDVATIVDSAYETTIGCDIRGGKRPPDFDASQHNNEVIEYIKNDLEETRKMTKNCIEVRIADKVYMPASVEWTQEAYKLYPTVDIEVDMGSPFTCSFSKSTPAPYCPKIKKVHFNPPATVVLWEDGTKTVVKAQIGEEYDREKGLAMAFTKKVLGNKGSYFDEIKKWTEKE